MASVDKNEPIFCPECKKPNQKPYNEVRGLMDHIKRYHKHLDPKVVTKNMQNKCSWCNEPVKSVSLNHHKKSCLKNPDRDPKTPSQIETKDPKRKTVEPKNPQKKIDSVFQKLDTTSEGEKAQKKEQKEQCSKEPGPSSREQKGQKDEDEPMPEKDDIDTYERSRLIKNIKKEKEDEKLEENKEQEASNSKEQDENEDEPMAEKDYIDTYERSRLIKNIKKEKEDEKLEENKEKEASNSGEQEDIPLVTIDEDTEENKNATHVVGNTKFQAFVIHVEDAMAKKVDLLAKDMEKHAEGIKKFHTETHDKLEALKKEEDENLRQENKTLKEIFRSV